MLNRCDELRPDEKLVKSGRGSAQTWTVYLRQDVELRLVVGRCSSVEYAYDSLFSEFPLYVKLSFGTDAGCLIDEGGLNSEVVLRSGSTVYYIVL